MRIVYYDYGGSHTSVVAANIHVGRLPRERKPKAHELLELPWFDKTTEKDFGHLHLVGTDESGHMVYVLGTKNSHYGGVLEGLSRLLNLEGEFLYAGTMPYVTFITRIGGFVSRSLSWTRLGRPLVILGIREAYSGLRQLVDRVRTEVKVG